MINREGLRNAPGYFPVIIRVLYAVLILWKCQRMWKKIKKAFIFKIKFLILQSDFKQEKVGLIA